MFRRVGEYVYPEKTLQNVKAFLKFAQEQGLTDDELYFVVKLIQAMFD